MYLINTVTMNLHYVCSKGSFQKLHEEKWAMRVFKMSTVLNKFYIHFKQSGSWLVKMGFKKRLSNLISHSKGQSFIWNVHTYRCCCSTYLGWLQNSWENLDSCTKKIIINKMTNGYWTDRQMWKFQQFFRYS